MTEATDAVVAPSPRQNEGVRALVLRGIRWKLASQVTSQLLRIAAGLLIARSLTPHEYGLAAMVLAFSGFVLAFSDLAFGAALVQRRRIDERDRSTVFWTTVAAGVLFTVIGLLCAGPVATFYHEPRVKQLFSVFSVVFLISALGATQQALLTREMDFRRLELRQIAASFAAGVAGATAALSGLGPWAIIAQQLALVTTSTLILWSVSSWRPKFLFSFQSLRELGSFSGSVFGSRLLYFTSENAWSLLIGRFLGSAALGTYSVAYSVILVPLLRIAGPIGEVLFPAFSRMQDNRDELARFWLRALRVLAAVCMPALLGLVIVAPDFVPVVLGHRWQAAVPVVQVLAWVGLLQSLDAWNGGILMGLGRGRTLFRSGLVFYTVFVASYAIGLPWGVVGVAVSYAIAITLMQFAYQWVTCKALAISPLAPVTALTGVAQAAALMAAAVYAVRDLLIDQGVGPTLRLPGVILVALVIYFAALRWRAPDVIRDVWMTRVRRRVPADPLASGESSGA